MFRIENGVHRIILHRHSKKFSDVLLPKGGNYLKCNLTLISNKIYRRHSDTQMHVYYEKW